MNKRKVLYLDSWNFFNVYRPSLQKSQHVPELLTILDNPKDLHLVMKVMSSGDMNVLQDSHHHYIEVFTKVWTVLAYFTDQSSKRQGYATYSCNSHLQKDILLSFIVETLVEVQNDCQQTYSWKF